MSHPESGGTEAEAKPRGPGRPKQTELTGFEAIEDKKLRSLAESYQEALTEAADARKRANDVNMKMVKHMKETKVDRVIVGGLYVFVDPGRAKAVVREKAASEDAANVRRSRKGAEGE